ncbi:hypothetical protein, partial [Mycobacterium marinum]|uniref:hypothetical protein n=1 Tax=Mycobacterium marinum TaxID=1781 RepID=UPI003566B86A
MCDCVFESDIPAREGDHQFRHHAHDFATTSINGSAPTNGAPLGYPSIYEVWHCGTGSVGANLPCNWG